MATNTMGRHVSSFGVGFTVAVLVTAVLFAIKAGNPELEEWGEATFGHAWLYQAVLALILFFGLGVTLTKVRLGAASAIWTVILSTVVSGLIILGAAGYAALQEEEAGNEAALAATSVGAITRIAAPAIAPRQTVDSATTPRARPFGQPGKRN